MSISEKREALYRAIQRARASHEKMMDAQVRRDTFYARKDRPEEAVPFLLSKTYDKISEECESLQNKAHEALRELIQAPPDPDPRLEPIPVGVHIGSKGCADRYKTNSLAPGERDKPQSCLCGPGKCWVTYARRQHEHKLPSFTIDQWVQAGMPDPLPSTRIFPIKAKPRKRKKP